MIEELKRGLGHISEGYADIRYEVWRTTSINMINGKIEVASTHVISGGSVRYYHRGAYGFSTFTRLEDIEGAVRSAESLAKLLKPKEEVVLKPQSPVKDIVEPKVSINPNKITFDEKVELVKKYHDLLTGNDKFVAVSVTYGENLLTRYFVNTEGTEIIEERPYCGISGSITGRDGNLLQRAFRSFGDLRGYETVLRREADFEEIKKDVLDLLRADKVEGGVYTVILDPQIAGVFIHEAFGHLSESDLIFRNEKLKEIMTLGKDMGTDLLSVVDDGSLEGERGFIAYDDDGIKSRKNYLIKNGKLVGRLHSRYTSSLMGEEPTGNSRAVNFNYMPIVRMTNTYIENGTETFEGLLEGIQRGLYVLGALGGQTELEMFTFSSAKAYKIENGKIGSPVRDVVLSGNVFETLKNIDAIGSDLQMYGGLGGCGKGAQVPLPVSDGAPHIRIKNVIIGGR